MKVKWVVLCLVRYSTSSSDIGSGFWWNKKSPWKLHSCPSVKTSNERSFRNAHHMLFLCPKIHQMTWFCSLDICIPIHGFSFLFGDHLCKEYIYQNEKNHNGHQRWTMKMCPSVKNRNWRGGLEMHAIGCGCVYNFIQRSGSIIW